MKAPLELLQARIATPGWTPGRRDIDGLFEVWRTLEDHERESMEKRLAKLDAPSARRAAELFASLDERSRGELARPILKSFLKTIRDVDTVIDFPAACLADSETRVRKAAAQAIGASWEVLPGAVKTQLVSMLIARLGQATDPSETKAVTDALGKSGDARALDALKQTSKGNTKALLTLERDIQRIDGDADVCKPMNLVNQGLVLWFTPGLELVARKLPQLLGADVLASGILRPENTAWQSLKENFLWRKAGLIVERDSERTPNSLARQLAKIAENLKAATVVASGGPVRVRLGRDDERGRSFVWDFARALSEKNSGLINDGRDAHWELRTVGDWMVLIPLKEADDRFGWRDTTVEGASDPTVAAAIVELADIKPSDKVYDPFCGAGTELILAARKEASVEAVGTDLNDAVLAAARSAMAKAQVNIEFVKEEALSFKAGPFDVVITNPPFGMRTVRGGARGLLEEFLGCIHKRLTPNGRLVMLSHAPSSTIQWAQAGRLKLKHATPVRLGGMNCELQVFERA